MVGENYVVIQQENFRLINLEYLYETAKPRYKAFTSATNTNVLNINIAFMCINAVYIFICM